ncbi:MAG: glycosyltransferase, partial [Candidatus Electrothrix sp. AR1]|nr:glycosyltransferase [Candidatus Electrothrix sp. AR1]
WVCLGLGGGGIERLSIRLSRYFLTQGYTVDLVLLQARGELLHEVPDEAELIDLKSSKIRFSLWPLIRYLKVRQPDVVIAIMWPLTVIAVLAHKFSRSQGRLLICDQNTLSIQYGDRNWFQNVFLGETIHFFYPLADVRIAVSMGVADDLAQIGKLKRSSLSVIYNPTAESQSLLQHVNADPWSKLPGKRIISVGSFKPQKDHTTLIRSFSLLVKHQSATLVILGEGKLRPDLERLINKLGLSEHVVLPGFMNEPYPWYLGADLFVLSSRWEGFGNVIVEALQCGVSVVSTDCRSGPREILEDGRYGCLVPVGDKVALATAMREALAKEPDRELLKARASEFSVERIGQQYLEVLFPGKSV